MSAHSGAIESIDRILNRGDDADEVLQAVVDVLYERFEHYGWVGIYFVEDGELVLGPWQGPEPTEHTRIAVGEGICGAAAASGETEVVEDVAADSRYLACFASTRSEIVVPVRWQGSVIAEIDIDSDQPAAFDAEDREFLEVVALRISAHCLVGWDTGGMPWDEVS